MIKLYKGKNLIGLLLICIILLSAIGCSNQEPVKQEYKGIEVVDGDFASAIDNAKIGELFILGTYEQDNNKDNGKEPLQWRVIDKNEKGVLLISEYILEYNDFELGQYITSTKWEDCSLRTSLNQFDVYKYFEDDELKHIRWSNITNPDNPEYGTSGGRDLIDRLFILNYDEVIKYFPTEESRKAFATETAKSKLDSEENSRWWLRTSGKTQADVMCVDQNGTIATDGIYALYNSGIRPALWLMKDEQTDIFGSKKSTYVNLNEAEIGNIICFGEYDQDGDATKKEPIEWIVLSKNEDKLLLISRYIIEKMQFGSNQYWETSEIREWLNGDFYSVSFADDEKEKIQKMITSNKTDDNVFLLSSEEARMFFTTDEYRIAHITERLGASDFKNSRNKGDWWTRSVSTATNGKGVVTVETNGNVRSAGTNPRVIEKYTEIDTGVRPVITVNLSGSTDISMNMEIFGRNSNTGLDNEIMPSSGNDKTCPNCNGTGYVKYYYGGSDLEAILDGYDPYTTGKCTMCN